MNKQFEIAYFSAEIGISSSIPTYSGGLGVLAGDHIKAAGDAGINMCAITLLYKEGYFKQRIDEDGIQTETYPRFDPEPLINQIDLQFSLQLQDREVFVQVFRFDYVASSGHNIPIYFLDTDLEKILKKIVISPTDFIPAIKIIVFFRKRYLVLGELNYYKILSNMKLKPTT